MLGEEPVSEACQNRKARLVLLAGDAGDSIVRRTQHMTGCGIPLVTLPQDKSEIGFYLGRGACAVLAVTDQGLASAVVSRLAEEHEEWKELAETMNAKTQRFKLRKEKKKHRAAKGPVEP